MKPWLWIFFIVFFVGIIFAYYYASYHATSDPNYYGQECFSYYSNVDDIREPVSTEEQAKAVAMNYLPNITYHLDAEYLNVSREVPGNTSEIPTFFADEHDLKEYWVIQYDFARDRNLSANMTDEKYQSMHNWFCDSGNETVNANQTKFWHDCYSRIIITQRKSSSDGAVYKERYHPC